MALREEIAALRARAGEMPLSGFFDELTALLRAHGDELTGISAACRFQAADTGENWGLALKDGTLSLLPEDAPAQVTVSGKEAVLKGVITGETAPAPALLLGRLRLKGDLRVLGAFARFL